MSTPRQAVKSDVLGIQIMRGVAATLVAVEHLVGQFSHNTEVPPAYDLLPGGMGVDIFFVISGFIMIFTSYDRFGGRQAAWNFAVRRLIRIVPLYWIFTTLIVLTLIVSPASFNSTELESSVAAGSYFFFPVARASGDIKPILSLGWTLNYEMLFYVIFTAAMLFSRRRGLILCFVVFAVLLTTGFLWTRLPTPLEFWTNSVIAEFLYGILLGLAFKRWGSRAISPLLWLLLFALTFVWAMIPSMLEDPSLARALPRALEWGPPATAMVGLATLWVPRLEPGRAARVGVMIGDSSYATYLSHRFVFGAAALIWANWIGIWTPLWFPVVVVLVVALVAGYLVHLLIEKPTLRFLNAALRPKQRTSASQHVHKELDGEDRTRPAQGN